MQRMVDLSKKTVIQLTLKLICKYAFPRPFRDFELKDTAKESNN